MYKILLPLASLAAGATIGSILTVNASLDIAKYLSIAILAALDSVLGGARALLEDTYDSLIMLSGFFINALLAMALAFLGDQIGIDMFMAATICFALRIFSNLAFIRRDIILSWRAKNAARQAAKNIRPNPPIRLISAPRHQDTAPAKSEQAKSDQAKSDQNKDQAKPEQTREQLKEQLKVHSNQNIQSNLENTIYDLVIDSAALNIEEEPEEPDQAPVKVKAIISSQSRAGGDEAEKGDKAAKGDEAAKNNGAAENNENNPANNEAENAEE